MQHAAVLRKNAMYLRDAFQSFEMPESACAPAAGQLGTNVLLTACMIFKTAGYAWECILVIFPTG